MADETTQTEATETTSAPEAESGKDWQAEAEKWKALARKHEERAKANATADEAARRLQAELEQTQSNATTDLDKLKAEVAELAAAREAEARARREAEVRAAAAGKLADPSDALRLLDVDSLDTPDAINAAVAALVESKPYLAGGTPKRFEGSADAGPRGDEVLKPRQLSRGDLASMSPQQIEAARAAGQLNDLMGIKS